MNNQLDPKNILYGYFIKYNKLMELTLQEFKDSQNASATKVNIYIDLYDMLYSLYTSKVDIRDVFSISSTIINLVAHLRGYYKRTHAVETKIYLVYGATNSSTQNKLIFGGYNRKGIEIISNNPNINKSISEVFNHLEILCKYIEEVYFIRVNEFDTATIIFDRILKEESNNPNIPNIVITKSLYSYQIPAYTMNTRIFRPYKSKGIDNSYIVNKSNCIYKYFFDRSRTGQLTMELDTIIKKLNPEIINLLMTLAGIRTRGVKPILNITSSLRELEKMIDNHLIINGYNSIIDYPIDVYRMNPVMLTNKVEIMTRFKGLDLRIQHMMFTQSVYFQTIQQSIIDLVDNEGFKYIAGKYYKDNPIDINNL